MYLIDAWLNFFPACLESIPSQTFSSRYVFGFCNIVSCVELGWSYYLLRLHSVLLTSVGVNLQPYSVAARYPLLTNNAEKQC